MTDLLIAFGGITFFVLIGVGYWWHELRKLEKGRKQGPPTNAS